MESGYVEVCMKVRLRTIVQFKIRKDLLELVERPRNVEIPG